MEAREDLALVCGLSGLTAWETEVLGASGWTVTRLATLEDCDEATLKAVLWQVQQREEEFSVDKEKLSEGRKTYWMHMSRTNVNFGAGPFTRRSELTHSPRLSWLVQPRGPDGQLGLA